MIDAIKIFCDALIPEFRNIPGERKSLLLKISRYIIDKRNNNDPINLVFICTHNSRRSHFGQIWAKVAAEYYNIKADTFSGGTESTAFNANAINALKRVGFEIHGTNGGANPVYEVTYDMKKSPLLCFSKMFSDKSLPQKNFAAIMTCSEADENCPFIPGADVRITTTYNDPKAYDNAPDKDLQYDATCKLIALETLFIFSNIR